jgi:Kef-type K+ transport system membrane component KefB
LLLLGWTVRQLTDFFGLHLPDFSSVLPILGTIGLILIVLEGSLELELNRSKKRVIRKSLFGALIPMFALAFSLAYLFQFFGNFLFKESLLNAIPFCVISSAIAIPSVRHLASHDKEYIIYESSLSDIFGVLLFNFIALNNNFNTHSFSLFAWQILIIILISFVSTIVLSLLLHKIEHHVKFVPIILLVILIYALSYSFHLPALIFILFFGLFIGNLKLLKRFKWIERFRPDELEKEVKRFKELTVEGAFLIRALFFLLFGYLIETSEILNTDTIIWATGIVLLIFIFRAIQLKLSKIPLQPLLFVAPRGLITILLFLSISQSQQISLVTRSLIIQVIILTALIMMTGLMTSKKSPEPISDKKL